MAVHTPSTRLLFLEKVFLRTKRQLPLRGVELFNLYLVRDLVRLGFPVTLVAGRSWRQAVSATLGSAAPRCIWVAETGLDVWTGFVGAWRAGTERYQRLILGNVGNSLLAALWWLSRRSCCERCVLIAHREASPRFVRHFGKMPAHVVAVNGVIAQPFIDAGMDSVHVDYGVMNAERFQPKTSSAGAGTTVDFCVLGLLDNRWKGADTAVRAFRRLPEDVRAKARLHLVSYMDPPLVQERNVIPYPWMPPDRIPGLLQEMDVLLVPSRDEEVMRETFSQAMVQGMLTGLPVIASDLPVLAEKLDAGGGVLFQTDSQLADAMSRLARDVHLRDKLGQQARRTALDRYVWDTERFVNRYICR